MHFKIANHHKFLIQLSTHHLSLKIKNLKESICNSKAKIQIKQAIPIPYS